MIGAVRKVDCLVVGGGAAGLATGLGLAQAGLSVLIAGVPKAGRDDGRSAALFQSTFAFLDKIGLGAPLRAKGWPLRAIRLIDVTGALIRSPTVTFKAIEIGHEAFGWNITNATIINEALARLRERMATDLPNLSLSEAFVDSMSFGDGARIVQLNEGSVVEARLVVGADGQNSPVRQAAGIGVTIKPYPQSAITTRFRHTKDHDDISNEFHTREGPFTFVPVAEGVSALVWIMKPERAEATMALDDAAFLDAVSRRATGVLGTLTLDGPRACVPMRKLVAEALTAERVALVGEAAHAFPPIGAQGLNLGLKDVEALVARVGAAFAAGDDPGGEACLKAYAHDRRFDVVARAAGVDMLNSALIADTLPGDLARAAGLRLMRDIAPLRHLAMRIGGWNPLFSRR